mgnify:CR=1 FL=1
MEINTLLSLIYKTGRNFLYGSFFQKSFWDVIRLKGSVDFYFLILYTLYIIKRGEKKMLNIENTKAIILTNEQWEAIEVVNNLTKDLDKAYPRETIDYLISPITGEIVEPIEFGRIRGVLDFISSCPFKVIPK